ncbi:hypothetical protein EJB05_48255 [Eragrostis curvula]|uniref:Uncharacterized protein n=1 Tax=Eragrostis curvula TaxID=38414 RepID=A0A5J9T1H0_9POAL|nr:hypothetical protein EJB05_48255 [Eragrostis curvula]
MQWESLARQRFLPVNRQSPLARELPPFVIQFVAPRVFVVRVGLAAFWRARVFSRTSRLSLGLACIVCASLPPPCLCGPHVAGSLALRGFVAGAVQPYRNNLRISFPRGTQTLKIH